MSWIKNISEKGEYQRQVSSFRHFITQDGSSGFPAEAGRYHLYVSLACPWATRTLITRELKGLKDVISVTIVDWFLDAETGWKFCDDKPKCTAEPNFGGQVQFLRQIYEHSEPTYSGRITVPVLFDKQTMRIVNNESSEIIRMLNTEFNHLSATPEAAALDLYPEALRDAINETNDWVYPGINNGVYRCGFARTQQAYDEAYQVLVAAMDRLEQHLSQHRYMVGNVITEADVRLFPTLIRYDPVYVGHFKCNYKRIVEYPNIFGYVRELFHMPAFRNNTDFQHIKHHYYESHRHINPAGVVPNGPLMDDYELPHGRDHLQQ